MQFSVIVPVYNRSEEVDELLSSLTMQTLADFEVIVVEDGSDAPCGDVCGKYSDKLRLKYFQKENSGPGLSRNFGAERASGAFLLFLDSDVMLSPDYIETVSNELRREYADAFGGPDTAHPSFSLIQKSISYAMTSFFTTGGIRGGKKKMDKFYPRSFNMGISQAVFRELGGFSSMRFGEDIDLSIRIFKAGYKCRLFPQAWVWHKRRTDFRKFFRQVFNSGIARINLYRKYPDSLKPVHLLPSVFTVGTTALVVAAAVFAFHTPGVSLLCLCPVLIYCFLICVDSTMKTKSVKVGMMSIPAAFVQLFGYGTGFFSACWQCIVKGREKSGAFESTFYK